MSLPPVVTEMNGTRCLGNSLVMCLVHHPAISTMCQQVATFGDLADVFNKSLCQAGGGFQGIDVVFDKYNQTSIKTEIGKRQGKTFQPGKSIDEGRNVPLSAK